MNRLHCYSSRDWSISRKKSHGDMSIVKLYIIAEKAKYFGLKKHIGNESGYCLFAFLRPCEAPFADKNGA